MQQFANTIYYVGGAGLILIGLYMVLAKTNLVKIILGISFLDTGTHVLLVAIGYVRGRTAPIFSEGMAETTAVVDPVRRRWCSPPSSSASACWAWRWRCRYRCTGITARLTWRR